MILSVLSAFVTSGALRLISSSDANLMLVDMVAVLMVQMVVVQVTVVIIVAYSHMTASGAVSVLVTLMRVTGHG